MHLTPNQINKTWEHPNLQPFNLNHRILVVAVCNLASLGLPSFDTKVSEYDFQKLLHDLTKVLALESSRSSDSPNTLNHKPAGEFQVACPGLLKELVDLKSITEISGDVRAIYKIVWEISQKVFDPAADRGAVIEPQQQEIVSVTTAVTKTTSTIPAGPDERTAKAASEDSEFTAALQKRWDRELKKLNSTVLLKMRKLARCALISLL
ncbi:hypothetical protein Clacol_001877 [Clathrus columnatus]|uniref:Uncharacterized protein n=1 Tax=Clathrus columnatus TaxID=1419009 RepID=A0AAV5A240_9AGAM|nr:hypothetical protein Clacol_001877 [Clathrus columnatus]